MDKADQCKYEGESGSQCAAFHQQQAKPINRYIIHGGGTDSMDRSQVNRLAAQGLVRHDYFADPP
jgi:hypothetical protein